ncbi:MAG: UDP-N-acetylmuramate dehydrogenase [Eubacteriales bacterium]|nr:UDP-N-acetylmuramate dehydrogenase [Eubacteriales bacterium]
MNPDNIKRIIKKGRIFRDEPMSAHTTFKVGGPAKMFVIPYNTEELAGLVRYLSNNEIPFYVTGNGSNLLVSDKGFDGVIINLGYNDDTEFTMLGYEEYENGMMLDAGAGCLMSAVGKIALNLGVTGFEPLSGIPGCVGGAVLMNAGAYGGEVKDVIYSVEAVTRKGNVIHLNIEDLSFGYRTSVIEKNDLIVARAEFFMPFGDKEKIQAQMNECMRLRREKQPLDKPSAGSTFKRPEGYYAGALIEEAGLKGFAIGGAKVSEKHAGFVINDGNATAADIYNIIKHIQKTVYERSSVELVPEVKMLGEF